jgi:hypothetical protein
LTLMFNMLKKDLEFTANMSNFLSPLLRRGP